MLDLIDKKTEFLPPKVAAAQEHLRESRVRMTTRGKEDSIEKSSQMMFSTFKDSLKLFLSSIKCQDPMDPVDTSEMAKQMFQLSQAQGQYAMLEKIEEQNDLLRSGQVLNASSFIGKTLEVKSDRFTLQDGKIQLGAMLPEGASKASFEIVDSKGFVVYEKEIQPNAGQKYLQGGKQELIWSGEVNTVHGKSINAGKSLEKGDFGVRVMLYDEAGGFLRERYTREYAAAETTIRAPLTGSDFADKQPKIVVNNQILPLSAIVSIQQDVEVAPEEEEVVNRGAVIRQALNILSEEERNAYKLRIQEEAKVAKKLLEVDQSLEQEVNYLPPENYNKLFKEIEEKLKVIHDQKQKEMQKPVA